MDPLTGMETVLVNKLPDGYFQFAPTEDYLLFTMTQEGPKERKEIYEVLNRMIASRGGVTVLIWLNMI